MLVARESLFGREFPNHVISLNGLEEYSIKRIIQNKNKLAKDTCEINITVTIFQECIKSETACATTSSLPQSRNEVCNFKN